MLLYRSKSCASTFSVGYDGNLSKQYPTQTASSPAPESHPVGSAASEHISSTCDSAATSELLGEAETVPATDPHQQGKTILSIVDGIRAEAVETY